MPRRRQRSSARDSLAVLLPRLVPLAGDTPAPAPAATPQRVVNFVALCPSFGARPRSDVNKSVWHTRFSGAIN
jgi:hypothetical protein